MAPISKPPIFCDDCASLALATVDDAPLCANCLQARLSRSEIRATARIEPLQFDDSAMSCNLYETASWIPEP